MDRRKFLTSMAVASGSIAARTGMGQQITDRNESRRPEHEYLDAKTGAGEFEFQVASGQRPNIFFITMDMVSPDFYLPSRPLYNEVHLPTIRSLAHEGVNFLNAFCTVPVCSPSRGSYLTGRYPYILGDGERAVDGLATELRPTDTIFPQYLKAAGYTTKHVGKCHVGTELFIDAFGANDNPWNQWSPPINDDENYLAYLKRMGIQQQRYSREIVGLQQDRKTRGPSLGGWIEQTNGSPFPLEGHYTYYTVQRAIEKVYAAFADPYEEKQPLYLQIDIFDPHQPLSVPDGFRQREEALRAAVRLPGTYETVRKMNWSPVHSQPKVYDIYRKAWGLYEQQTLRDYLVAYALQMEVVDRSLAELMRYLKQQHLYDEALIIVASDHGEMSGRWGIVDKGSYLYPDVIRAPLIIKPPASWQVRPHTVEAPVSLLDIAPTLFSVAGVKPEARLDGRSLIPYLKGTIVPSDRELIFGAAWHTGVNFAIGTQMWDPSGSHYLYSYNISSRVEELYDLNSQDAENLVQQPQYRAVHREMINRLGRLLQADARWLGYWSSFRLDHFADLPVTTGDQQLIVRG